MAIIDKVALLHRIEKLLATDLAAGNVPEIYAAIVEAMQGTLTLARLVYGDDQSPQVQTIIKAAQVAREDRRQFVAVSFLQTVWPAVQGSLRAMKADVESGLVGNIERRVAGEVIADMLGLAKEALGDGSDGAKNVAAVLTAAAFEDTVRKMGATFASVQGRPDLSAVLTALKNAGVLVGAPFATAQSYLKFRNDALHAHWAQLNPAVVGSCLTFVEQLILQHLS